MSSCEMKIKTENKYNFEKVTGYRISIPSEILLPVNFYFISKGKVKDKNLQIIQPLSQYVFNCTKEY